MMRDTRQGCFSERARISAFCLDRHSSTSFAQMGLLFVRPTGVPICKVFFACLIRAGRAIWVLNTAWNICVSPLLRVLHGLSDLRMRAGPGFQLRHGSEV